MLEHITPQGINKFLENYLKYLSENEELQKFYRDAGDLSVADIEFVIDSLDREVLATSLQLLLFELIRTDSLVGFSLKSFINGLLTGYVIAQKEFTLPSGGSSGE